MGVTTLPPRTDAYFVMDSGEVRNRVETLLLALPEEPYEIARQLADLKVTGVTHDGYECAIAELLYRETGVTVFCQPDWAEVPVYNEAGFQVSHVDASVPPNVARFMELFDAGHFPKITREDVSLV